MTGRWAAARRGFGHAFSPYPLRDLPTGRYLELPGRGTTYITDSGPRDAPVVMLLHSVTTTGQMCWYPSIPALNREFRVLTIDHRWHGRGIRSATFTLDDCADDAVAAAERLGVDSFIAAGFSMGGGIAQLAWRRHPGRVSGLVLCSTGPYFSSIDPVLMEAEITLGRRLAPIDRLLPRPSELKLDNWRRHPARWAIAHALATPIGHYGVFSEAMSRFDSRGWLAEVDVPTSVVVSVRDTVVQPERQQLLVDGIPDARRFEVDGGHACCVLGADRFIPPFAEAVRSVAERGARPAG